MEIDQDHKDVDIDIGRPTQLPIGRSFHTFADRHRSEKCFRTRANCQRFTGGDRGIAREASPTAFANHNARACASWLQSLAMAFKRRTVEPQCAGFPMLFQSTINDNHRVQVLECCASVRMPLLQRHDARSMVYAEKNSTAVHGMWIHMSFSQASIQASIQARDKASHKI